MADQARYVNLKLEKLEGRQAWTFKVESSTNPESMTTSMEHASGMIGLVPHTDLTVFERLTSTELRVFKGRQDLETLHSGLAYRIFSKVVDYGNFFRGIQSISMHDRQAFASIQTPKDQSRCGEDIMFHLDAVAVDSFIQTVGLLVNSSDTISSKEILIAASIDKVQIARGVKMDSSTTWSVYAKYGMTDKSHAVGDVFVYTKEGSLVMVFIGCRFMMASIERMVKLLGSTTLDHASRRPIQTSLPQHAREDWIESLKPSSQTNSESSIASSRSASLTTPPSESGPNQEKTLRELISEYTGMPPSQILADTVIAELGVDSLTTVEMTEEIATRYKKSFSLDIINTITFGALLGSLSPEGLPSRRHDQNNSRAEKSAPHTSARSISADNSASGLKQRQALSEILDEYCGASGSIIEQNKTVGELGIDSLSIAEMKNRIQETFNVHLSDNLFNLDSTASMFSTLFRNPSEALFKTERGFHQAAERNGLANYWSTVAPIQQELSAAYILEAYKALDSKGINLSSGHRLGLVPCLPKYDRLANRFMEILESENILYRDDQGFLCTGKIPTRIPDDLVNELIDKYPWHEIEARLMAMTGSRIADCISGKTDPMSLFFGNAKGSNIMESFYSKVPLLATMTDQLVELVLTILLDVAVDRVPELKILEIGAGSGGTSQALAEALLTIGLPVEYTFTDIAPRLVQKVRKQFERYPFMKFDVLDIEARQTRPQKRYDLVISTNCVHATASRLRSLVNIKKLLNDNGLVILSEGVRATPWCDTTFGLLDGWWSSPDYPMQPVEVWMSDFKAAGYTSYMHSQGLTLESNTQCLLLGLISKKHVLHRPVPVPRCINPFNRKHRLKTFTYKTIDNLELLADVYLPIEPSTEAMPIGKP